MGKHLALSLTLFLSLSLTTAAAQNEAPRFELFGGYAAAGVDISTNFPFTQPQRATGHGFAISASWYFSRWAGANFDFGGAFSRPQASFVHPQTDVATTAEMENRLFTILAGPVFRYPTERASFFVRPAIGQFRLTQEVPTEALRAVDNDFAFAFGGGVDVVVHRRVALRFAPDYIRSWLTPGPGQHNWRFATGLVIR